MSISASSVLYVLGKFRDLKDKTKAIETLKVDGREVKTFKVKRIDLDIQEMNVEIEYQLPSGKTTYLHARHIFRSDKPDLIKVNDKDVEDDKVDFDIDIHLLRADIEYRISYIDGGIKHKVYMLASIDWF